jgi:hypothetical protein
MVLGVCFGVTACDGPGDGRDQPRSLALIDVTVSDAFGSKVVGATVKGPNDTSTTDAAGSAKLFLDTTTVGTRLTVSSSTFMDKSVVVGIVEGQVIDVAVTLDRASSASGGSLTP